jgi:SHS2 domain-containing protein
VSEYRKICVEGQDDEELILNWLREILYSFESEGMLYTRFDVEVETVGSEETGRIQIKGRLGGEKLNPTRHGICTEIKAITRHGLAVKKRNHGWELTLLFDV